MVPIDVGDSLDIAISQGTDDAAGAAVSKSAAGRKPPIELTVAGRPAPSGRENLVFRAAEIVLEHSRANVSLRIGLEKRLPSGAGLGGGSSDAASTLRLVSFLLGIDPGRELLMSWATSLGADVPFFVDGVPALATGIGERLSPIRDWPRRPLVVAFRGAGIPTARVFSDFDASLTSPQVASSIPVFPKNQSDLQVNDLESAAVQIDPGISSLKQGLVAQGAREVGMSGSGSAVFGFFDNWNAARACATRMSENGDWAEAAKVLEGPASIESVDAIPNKLN